MIKFSSLLIIFLLGAFLISPARGWSAFGGNFIFALSPDPVEIYLFYGRECPASAREINFLTELTDQYPQLKVRSYEIYDPGNKEYFRQMCRDYGISFSEVVPVLFIGNKQIIGFDQETDGKKIEKYIKELIENKTEMVSNDSGKKINFIPLILFFFAVFLVFLIIFKKRSKKGY